MAGKTHTNTAAELCTGQSNRILVSVIIPAYNSGVRIRKSVDSIIAQTLPQSNIEIIVVNDGSTDNTLEICREYTTHHSNIVIVNKDNGGVSSSRNRGIEIASGKYIAFLDSDDTLLPNTLEAAVDFFESHYDEIDVVAYPMLISENGKTHSHVRESILSETGVYDLDDERYAFSLITNVNVILKNTEALPRFDEQLQIHEDLFLLLPLLLKKRTVGFSKQGAYCYERNDTSATKTRMHPYYQFENYIASWEKLFERYSGDTVPVYLQASYLNEILWKLKTDLLLPYHFDSEEYNGAILRIRNMLSHVDNRIIAIAPRMDVYYRDFFLRMKNNADTLCCMGPQGIAIISGNVLVCRQDKVALTILETVVFGNILKIKGTLQSPLFNYYKTPYFYLTDGRGVVQEINLKISSFGRHQCHNVITTAYYFDIDINLESTHIMFFNLHVDGNRLPLKVYFGIRSRFNYPNRLLSFAENGYNIQFNIKDISININHSSSSQQLVKKNKHGLGKYRMTAGRILSSNYKKHTRIWLYYDRSQVGKDNSYYQFIHDIKLDDGIERYYITDNVALLNELSAKNLSRHAVAFGSIKHKLLHIRAELLLVSYMEPDNWKPFTKTGIASFADLINYRIVYLQHGVLHAHMPWKYSADRLLPDYEVVSTNFEIDSLKKNYCFDDSQLIPSGMPRYDYIQSKKSKSSNRILYMPTWRKYLVVEDQHLNFKPIQSFETSRFAVELFEFLSSNELDELLEANDLYLDIKLHPIFNVYKDVFKRFANKRIHVLDSVDAQYSFVITDYSSYVYDFVYQETPVIYFVPDYEEFKSGLNGYRKLDLPIEEGFGPMATSADEIIATLRDMIEGKIDLDVYAKRGQGLFLHKDNNQCDRLYSYLISVTGNMG